MTDGRGGPSWGRIIVGALLVVVGGGWLLQTAGLLDFPLRALTPLALIGVGVGLVIASRHGSYPGLIAVGVVLTIILAVSPFGGVDRRGEWRSFRFDRDERSRVERPRDASDLRPYDIDAGRLTIDLTHLRLEPRTYEVEARVDVGQLHVIVPDDVPISVEAESSVGNIMIFGNQRSSGISADEDFESPGYDDARPRFELELEVRVGSIRVTQGRSRTPPEPKGRRRGSA